MVLWKLTPSTCINLYKIQSIKHVDSIVGNPNYTITLDGGEKMVFTKRSPEYDVIKTYVESS